MIQRSFERSVAWATRLRDKVSSDPFLSARLKTTGLILLMAIAINLTFNLAADHYLRLDLHALSASDSKVTVEAALAKAVQTLWLWRGLKLMTAVICSYFIAAFVLRPIRRSSELQKRFASIASHELRTPLAVMKTGVEVALRDNNLSADKARKALVGSLDEIQRMADITDFLMLYTKLKEKDRNFTRRPMLLMPVIKEAAANLQALSGRRTEIVGASYDVMVIGNATALYMLMLNLLKNAIAHTDSQGTIKVSVTVSGPYVELCVIDKGTGIPSADLPYIFEPFYRGENESDINQRGMGIGLAIVKEIADMHRAKIKIRSIEGSGTAVTITLRKA